MLTLTLLLYFGVVGWTGDDRGCGACNMQVELLPCLTLPRGSPDLQVDDRLGTELSYYEFINKIHEEVAK